MTTDVAGSTNTETASVAVLVRAVPDGFPSADVLLADLYPGLGNSEPQIIGSIEDRLYAVARTPDGVAIFSTDGASVVEHAALDDRLPATQIGNAFYFEGGTHLQRFTPDDGLVTLEAFTNPRHMDGTIFQFDTDATTDGEFLYQTFEYVDVDGRSFSHSGQVECLEFVPCGEVYMEHVHAVRILGVFADSVIVDVYAPGDYLGRYLAHGASSEWVPVGTLPEVPEATLYADGVPLLTTWDGAFYSLDGALVVDEVQALYEGVSFYAFTAEGSVGRVVDGAFVQMYQLDAGVEFGHFQWETPTGIVASLNGHNYHISHDGVLEPWTGGVMAHEGVVVLKRTDDAVYYTDSLTGTEIVRMYQEGIGMLHRVGDRFVYAGYDLLAGRELLVRDMLPGDADVDGVFDSGDLVDLFATGKYEADVDASWLDGDFNGDGRFDSSDLIEALASGAYAG